jgi:DNA polymerase III alpha subunit (gram-positive type)
MSYVILDLEWNGSYSKKLHRYVNEIIEFGAVKIDDYMNMVDTFSMLVKPQIGKKLNSHIADLTHITEDELFDSNNTFMRTINKFVDFAGDSILLTWGTSDILALMENYSYFTGNDRLPFMKYYCDLQYYCEKKLDVYDPASQLGLQTCADMLNINSNGEELHRAYTDAELSYCCFKKLYNPSDIGKYISAADDKFYRKITFKNRQLTDIDNPMIDKSKMFFDCDDCGIRAEQISHFKVKNKSFIANFRCPKCRKQFKGKVTARLKFDGVTLNKKIVMPKQIELVDD